MSYTGYQGFSEAHRASIEDALTYVATIVTCAGGDVYMPLFERLECELEALTRQENALERAHRLSRQAQALAQQS